MRIALTADPELPVPPLLYGGIERIVDLLAVGLKRRGHDVVLFSNPASTCAVERVAWPGASSSSRTDSLRNAGLLAMKAGRGGFDLVHSFSRLAYLAPILPLPIPKLMSYQRDISTRTTSLAHRLSRGTLEFTAISEWMMRPVRDIGTWHLVPNAVPLDRFRFQAGASADAPLVFLGRVEPIKGPDVAIDIARRSGRRLLIAGNIPPEHEGFFEQHVRPHIDGDRVRYVGPVDDAQKNELLGSAAGFLMPISWEEPFGIVMIEALACGTPVLGFRRGAVPEIIDEGITGFVRDTAEELASAVARLGEIDRSECRRRVASRYSADVVVDRYLDIYQTLLGGAEALDAA